MGLCAARNCSSGITVCRPRKGEIKCVRSDSIAGLGAGAGVVQRMCCGARSRTVAEVAPRVVGARACGTDLRENQAVL